MNNMNISIVTFYHCWTIFAHPHPNVYFLVNVGFLATFRYSDLVWNKSEKKYHNQMSMISQ